MKKIRWISYLMVMVYTILWVEMSTVKAENAQVIGTLVATNTESSETADTEVVEKKSTWPAGIEVEGGNAIVMEVETGTVLFEKNAHEQNYPASITKILTAMLAIENSNLQENVTFSYDSVHKTEGSSIWRDVDEVMTMEQCLYALMLNSANECAYAIAEHVGGTYEAFIQMMNEKAKSLGCTETNFTNPHGLTDENHYTSCYDMALIAREAIKNDIFCEIIGTRRYDIPPTNKHPNDTTYLSNHHKMIWEREEYYYEECLGGKTGYTQAAGNSLVTYAKKNGMTLVCVVMREKTPGHYTDTRKLLDYCFENFKLHKISENLVEPPKEPVPEEEFLEVGEFANIDEEAVIVLPVEAEFSEAVMSINYENQEEDALASMEYQYQDRFVGKAKILRTTENRKTYDFQLRKEEVDLKKEKKDDIDLKILGLVFGGILILAGIGFGIYKFWDNFHLIRYHYYSRKGKDLFHEAQKRKRKRRR